MTCPRTALLPVLATVLCLSVVVFAPAVRAAEKNFSFGVVPQQSARKLAENWGPLCAWLSAKTGFDIRFATAPDIPSFEKRLAEGLYDMAYMNPYHYTVFSKNPGYLPLARQRDKQITGIIVVRKDAPYRTCRDLAGKVLAFPSPAAFAASILPQAYFRGAGIPITPRYVKSHDSVYQNVARGFFEAGGGVVRTFLDTEEIYRRELKIFWRTAPYTPHAIAVHPRIEPADRQKILSALIAMNEETEAASLLSAIRFNGFTAAADTDWDDVRALEIEEKITIAPPEPN